MTQKDKTAILALWIADYGRSFLSLDEWVASAEYQIEQAAAAEAELLLWPEWLSHAWFGFAPKGLSLSLHPWSEETANSILPMLAKKAENLGVTLVAGTTPASNDNQNGYFNRARIFLPDGEIYQDKLLLSRIEQKLPGCRNGDTLCIFNWQGWRVAVLVCLDSEWPHLAAQLVDSDIDLLLIPSMTRSLAGHNRVHKCAQARAVEMFCPVAVVGGVGTTPTPEVIPPHYNALTNVAGAAVYLPCEKSMVGGTGILSQIEPMTEIKEGGLLHIVRDVPIGFCRRMRHEDGTEIWPKKQMGRSIEIKNV